MVLHALYYDKMAECLSALLKIQELQKPCWPAQPHKGAIIPTRVSSVAI